MKRKVLILLLIALAIIPLMATASYQATNPIVWTDSNQESTQFSGHLSAHIGTITIVFNYEPDLSKIVLINLGNFTENSYTAKTAWNTIQSSTFKFYAITKVNNIKVDEAYMWTDPADTYPFQLLGNASTSFMGKTVTVDFYIVTDTSAAWHAFPTEITLQTDLASGTIAMAKSKGSIWNPSNLEIIPMDSGAYNGDPSKVDILGGQPKDENGDIITYYGDAPSHEVPEYSFSIINNSVLNLRNCQGTSKQQAAQIAISVLNVPGAVTLSFSKAPSSIQGQFAFRHEAGLYTVPYTLLLGDSQTLNLNDTITWSPLPVGLSTKDLYVTGIEKSVVDNLLAGSYTDSIIVTITPVDTI